MLTGAVYVDLTTVKPEKMAGRVSMLAQAPVGATATVYVGPLAAEPSAVRVLRRLGDRLNLTVEGEPHAVQLWLTAVREGLPGELVIAS